MTARVEPVPAEPSAEWLGLIAAVGDELTVAVEETIEMMMGLSYRVIDESTLRSTVTSRFEMVVGGVGARRPPGLPEDEFSSDAFGELRARQGVTYADLLIGWRFGGDALYRLARRVAPDIPRRDSLLLEFLELTVRWVDYACLAMPAGHRRGELSRARELQHVQTNLVRRVLSGVAGPAELRNGLEPLHLDPDALYVAVCARPTARADTHHIEQYLGVDGLHGRRNGLTALIDGDLRGFVLPALPREPAPTVIGLSEPALLTAFQGPIRRADRALETALTFAVPGTFDFASLAVQAGILRDRDTAEVLHARYIAPLMTLSGGDAILETMQRLLANDQNIATTAHTLGVHANTVRHRVKRFQEITNTRITDHQTTIELWWALQANLLAGG